MSGFHTVSADRVAVVVGYAGALVIAAATFVRSFAAMADFAVRVGAARPGWDAWLVPTGVDVAIVAGSVLAWTSARAGRRNAWAYTLFAAAAIISTVLNVAHAPPNPWARFIAGLQPLLLLWISEVVLRSHTPPTLPDRQPVAAAATDPAAEGVPASLSAAELPAPPEEGGATERARRVLAAYVATGGGADDPGLAAALAERAGCHLRTAQRAIADARDHHPAAVGSGDAAREERLPPAPRTAGEPAQGASGEGWGYILNPDAAEVA